MKITSNVYFLGLLSSFLMWLAWPPIYNTTPLLLIGLVPLLVAIDAIRADSNAKKGKRIFLTAGLTFLVWNTASIYWVYNAISAFNTTLLDGMISLLITMIPYGLGALLMTFAFWLYYRLSLVANKYVAYSGLICFYIGMEYLHQNWELNFPWMTLGNGLAGMHQLAQWYEYTGVYGGSLWILLSNILAFEAYNSFKTRSGNINKLPVASWLAILVIPIGFSLSKYYTYTEKIAPLNVVTVQPNIDPYEKFTNVSARSQLDILMKLSDSVGQSNTEYFLWPETAIPNYADEDRIRSNPEFLAIQQFLEKYRNGNVLTGLESVRFYNTKKTLTARQRGDGLFQDSFNAAMQVENSANVQFYHKSKLVPGVEKMPFPQALSILAPVFEELGGSSGGWGWQDQPGTFFARSGIGVVPVICYESLWGEWIGEAVKNGGQFIAIITNDGWWGNTSGKDQHFLYAKLRAIENRRYVVRSANTGISCFINQRGDVLTQSKWWTRTALKADINLNDEITPYVKNGDVIAIICCIIGALLALLIPYYKIASPRKR